MIDDDTVTRLFNLREWAGDPDDRATFRRILPEVSETTVDWVALVYSTLRAELSYKAIPHDLVRDLLPILAGLGFDWPARVEMNIKPRMKRCEH